MNKFIEIKNSEIAGEGLFAKVDIKKGEKIGVAFERIADTGIPDKDYLRTRIGEKMNHSSNPNIELKHEGSKFCAYTKDDVNQGDELTLDYKKINWEGNLDFLDNIGFLQNK